MARRSTSVAMMGLGVVAEEKAPRLGIREIRLLIPYLRPYLKGAIASGILLILATLMKLVGPVFLRFAIDQGIGTEGAAGDISRLNLFGGLFIAAALIGFVTLRWSTSLMGRVGETALRDLRISSFKHLASLSLGFFERERSGRLIARITSDIEAVERLVTESLVRIGTEVLFMVGAAIVLFFLDYRLALAAMTVLPLMVIATFFFRRASERTYSAVRERVASVLSFIQETLAGVHVVQAFATQRARSMRFREVNEDWAEANVDAFKLEAYYFPVMEFLSILGTGIVLVYGGSLVLEGDPTMTFGVLAAFIVFLSQFFDPIHHLSELYARFQAALAGLARVAQLLESKPDIVDRPGANTITETAGGLTLDKVSFSYRPGGALALENVSLEIAPGEVVALVGPTGAGKSTIVKLLARFYDPSKGEILLDGTDLRDIRIASLRDRMALIPQEGVLFAGTVRDNIRFGNPEASDAEIEEVCRRILIDDFIKSLPDGYETPVRERGSRLAAGEKQLIALARALIAKPDIILLDEATSSLDSATEARVEGAFRHALQGCTSVIIAHRLSTVFHADRTCVVDDGRITEMGTHNDLVARGGKYAALYSSWLAGGLPETSSA